jgi:predicted AlkP superfamily phosphohydrolase/phosphomutase
MNGIVDEETAVSLAQQIKKNMLAIRHPQTGQPVIKNVYLKDEIYEGNATDLLPDIIVEPAEGYMIATELNNDTIVSPVPTFMTGTHLRDGIIIMAGPIVAPQMALKDAHIVDLLPTILYALDVPIPADLDGKVLFEAFTAEYTKAHQAAYYDPDKWLGGKIASNSAEEEKIVEERLKSLGYLG